MEKDSAVKRSVAELAGKFNVKSPVSTGDEAKVPVRRRPPRTLQLPTNNDADQSQNEKGEATSHPPRKRNSALIEKLQANLVLSPSALLPSPLSPGPGKPHIPCISPVSPCSQPSLSAASTPGQDEAPASFENPADGSVLLSVQKGRARHSIKRRPPSRRHRKSSSDEGGTEEVKTVSRAPECSAPDASGDDVFDKEKKEKEESDRTDSAAPTSEPQEEQNQSTDSEKQDTTVGENESKEGEKASTTTEKDEKGKEEKSDKPQLANETSDPIKQELHEEEAKEPEKTTEVKEQEEEKAKGGEKEKGGEKQNEESKGSEQ